MTGGEGMIHAVQGKKQIIKITRLKEIKRNTFILTFKDHSLRIHTIKQYLPKYYFHRVLTEVTPETK